MVYVIVKNLDVRTRSHHANSPRNALIIIGAQVAYFESSDADETHISQFNNCIVVFGCFKTRAVQNRSLAS